MAYPSQPFSKADGIVMVGVIVIYSTWIAALFTWLMAIQVLFDPRLVASKKTAYILKTYACALAVLSCCALFGNRTALLEESARASDSMSTRTVPLMTIPVAIDVVEFVHDSVTRDENVIPAFMAAGCLVLSVLLADSFLLWRCWMLYRASTRLRRFALAIFSALLFLALIALSVVYLASFTRFDITQPIQQNKAPLYFVSVTLGVNVILTTLIVSRLLYHHSWVSGVLGNDHGRVYRQIMFMCLEAAVPVVVMDAICIACFIKPERLGASIPYECLVHVYTIAPMFIIYRVTSGRIPDYAEKGRIVQDRLTTLAFAHSMTMPLGQNTPEGVSSCRHDAEGRENVTLAYPLQAGIKHDRQILPYRVDDLSSSSWR